jgi:DNA-binding MarR family transcriptional regulator
MNKQPAATDLAVLLHAAAAAQDDVEGRLGEIGLSLAKLAALKVLSDAGESLPLTQLADRLSCVKSNITQLVDRLEADGLVERQANPNDRRARLATLTASGRKACRDGSRIQESAEKHVLRKLTAAESRQLAELLTKITGG